MGGSPWLYVLQNRPYLNLYDIQPLTDWYEQPDKPQDQVY